MQVFIFGHPRMASFESSDGRKTFCTVMENQLTLSALKIHFPLAICRKRDPWDEQEHARIMRSGTYPATDGTCAQRSLRKFSRCAQACRCSNEPAAVASFAISSNVRSSAAAKMSSFKTTVGAVKIDNPLRIRRPGRCFAKRPGAPNQILPLFLVHRKQIDQQAGQSFARVR